MVSVTPMGMAVQDQIGTVLFYDGSKFSSVCQPFTPAHGTGCRRMMDQYDPKEFATGCLIQDFFKPLHLIAPDAADGKIRGTGMSAAYTD
jgi:hypothetical protein